MESRDVDSHFDKKSKNQPQLGGSSSSKEGGSFWSLFRLKSPFLEWKKVVPGKDINGKGDHNSASTSASVLKFDNKKKQPVFNGEQSKPEMVGDLNEMPSSCIMEVKIVADVDIKFQCFKRFDIVTDCSDHFYRSHANKKGDLHTYHQKHSIYTLYLQRWYGAHTTFVSRECKSSCFRWYACKFPYYLIMQPSKDWLKRIQNEWRILESSLPETIFVRVYEDRMDLLRAGIIGPAGTPYHDGLFFFDVLFQGEYPYTPPKVYFHSSGLRLNPNLYECGKVCLSLLNTWHGSKHEKWNPKISTILQVLVSIQGLVLNEKPYFNEPENSHKANTLRGEESSLLYTRQVFLLSCKIMLQSMRNPLKHFEDFIDEHFRKQGRAILLACKAYRKGALIGSVRGDGVMDADKVNKYFPSGFKDTLGMFSDKLFKEFVAKGVDCSGFSS